MIRISLRLGIVRKDSVLVRAQVKPRRFMRNASQIQMVLVNFKTREQFAYIGMVLLHRYLAVGPGRTACFAVGNVYLLLERVIFRLIRVSLRV